jgi:beta-glucanase (GH16 family)
MNIKLPKNLRIGLVIVFVVAVASIGSYLLFHSHAATPTASLESERGSVNNPAASKTDATASGGKAVLFGPASTGSNLVFDDEFSGSSVDTSKWTVWNNTTLSYDAEYITSRPQNLFEQNGILTLRALKESLGGRSYTSAYLNTIGKQNFGVGYRYEIRAKTPTQPNTSAGIWPAFWLRSNETPAELDLAEWYGNPQPSDTRAKFNKFTITVHSDTSGVNEVKNGYDAFFPGTTAPWDGFHTYAVDVKADGYYFYLDGNLVHTTLLTAYPWTAAGLNSTWNMRLNLQVGLAGKWAGAPDANTLFPADYQVDYVRVYKL